MCSTTLNCKVHHGQEARVQEPEGAGHIPSSRQQRARNTRVLQPRVPLFSSTGLQSGND